MRLFFLFVILVVLPMFFIIPTKIIAAEQKDRYEEGYLVVEGKVDSLKARMLIIDGQQYPVSVFVRVFDKSLTGMELRMQTLVNVGKIDHAKIYLLGGKVEKIVVIINI